MVAAALALLLLAPDPVAELRETLRRHEKDPHGQSRRAEAVRELGRIGSPDAVRVLEGVLADPWVHLRDEAQGALVQLRRLPAGERAAAVELLAGFLEDRTDEETRRRLATALGLIGDRRAAPALAAALEKASGEDLVEALAAALARMPDDRGMVALRARATTSPTGRGACLRALASFDGGIDIVLGWAGAEDDDVRAAVADAMARAKREVFPGLELDVDGDARCGERLGIALADALPAGRDAALVRRRAEALLRHPSWRVRAAALTAVVALRDPSLAGDLVDRLADPEARIRLDAWRALRTLLARDLPADPGLWRALLPVARLPEAPTPPDPLIPATPSRATATCFGLPVASGRIAFVVDVSGAMRDGGRMERARRGLAATLGALGPDARCDLFAYRYPLEWPPRPRLERCFGRLAAGRGSEAGALLTWLDGQAPGGGNALFDALAAALADDDADTVVVIGAGAPGFGTVTRDVPVLEEVARRNRWRRVAIHAVFLGTEDADRAFMRRLAAENGGWAVDGEGRPLK